MLILSAPVHYTFELYPLCNNHCRGCGNVVFDEKKPFSAAAWRDILDKIHPHATHVRLSGGEPTLHPEFEAVVHALSNLNIPFVIFTNGRWMNPDHIIHLLHRIPQCRGMLVSLHAHVPEIHDAFTDVRGSFTETVRNIRNAVDHGLAVAASTILMPSNIRFVHEMLSFFETLGVCQTTFSRYVAVRNHDADVGPGQLRSAIEAVEQRRAEGSNVEYSVCIPQCFIASSSIGCLSGVAYCIIDPWGDVRPCTHVPMTCGNILKQPMEEIWNGPAMAQWRSMIPETCTHCAAISTCRGGCRAAAFINSMACDPLMTGPLIERPPAPDETITLHEDMIPANDFIVRRESFGYALIRENRIVPVSFKAKRFLDLLGSGMSLGELNDNYGDQLLNFVGYLYGEGILEMKLPYSKSK